MHFMRQLNWKHQINRISTSSNAVTMTFLLHLVTILAIITVQQAEWVEIAQRPKIESKTNQTKSSAIRILKRNEAELLYNKDNTTPSPQWLEYQRERFGQKQNSNSQKLIVSTENHLKNSVKIIVPANRVPQSQIIQTKTGLDVFNNRPKDELIELPQLTTQTATTKRDMSHVEVNNDFVEYEEIMENVDETIQANTPANDDTAENGIQMPSWQGFLKFLKTIQANWLKHSGFSIEDKIRVLKKLRDRLMHKIEEQFSMIWTPKERLRRKRGILDESTINFPPEASLMSINFLTFAVFLIKLMLQIVHIIRSKHYQFTGLGITSLPFGKTAMKS